MGAPGFEFVTAIKDQISGPSKAAKAALSGLKDQMKETAKQIEALKDKQLKYKEMGLGKVASQAGLEIQKLSRQYKKQGDEVKALSPPTEKAKGGLMGMMGASAAMTAGVTAAIDVIKSGIEQIKDFALAVIDVTIAVMKFVAASAAMKESQLANYSLFTKTAAQGEKSFQIVDDIAKSLYIPSEKAHDYAIGLLNAGIKPNRELQKSVQAIAELSKVGGAAAADKLKTIIETASKSRTTAGGRSWGGTFSITAEELRGVGLSWDDLTKTLSKQMHKTVTAQDIMMGKVRISADQGIAALTEAISGGKVGKTAKDMVGGLDTVATHLRDTLTRLSSDVGKEKGFKEFIESLHELISVFDPVIAKGEKAAGVKILGAAFGLVAKAIEWVTIAILDVEVELINLYIAVAPALNALSAFARQHDALGKFKTLLQGLVVVMAILAVTTFITFLPLLLLIAAIVALVVTMAVIFGVLVDVITDVGKAIGKHLHPDLWRAKATDMAQSLVDGLVGGIRKGLGAVKDAMKDLSDGTLGALKTALDMHSPSRKMMQLGRLTAEGFQMGMDDIQPSLSVGAPNIQPNRGGGKVSVTFGDINIDASGVKDASEIGPLIQSEMADAAELFALAMGG